MSVCQPQKYFNWLVSLVSAGNSLGTSKYILYLILSHLSKAKLNSAANNDICRVSSVKRTSVWATNQIYCRTKVKSIDSICKWITATGCFRQCMQQYLLSTYYNNWRLYLPVVLIKFSWKIVFATYLLVYISGTYNSRYPTIILRSNFILKKKSSKMYQYFFSIFSKVCLFLPQRFSCLDFLKENSWLPYCILKRGYPRLMKAIFFDWQVFFSLNIYN